MSESEIGSAPSRYVVETGEGYAGVRSLQRGTTFISITDRNPCGWEIGDPVFVVPHEYGLMCKKEFDADFIDVTVIRNDYQKKAPHLCLKRDVRSEMGLKTRDDIRIYIRDEGLLLVDAENDPTIGAVEEDSS